MSDSAALTGVVKELSLSLTDFRYDLEHCVGSLLLPAAPLVDGDESAAHAAVDNSLRADSDRKVAMVKAQAADGNNADDNNLAKV